MTGTLRVVIENVQPDVEWGKYPAKRTIGEYVNVTADIFSDGHDHIRARLHYKHESSSEWQATEMFHGINDQWSASFQVDRKGYYLFTLSAWVDHFETWHDGFKKKAAVKSDVRLELLEGAAFLRKVSGGTERKLLHLAEQLEDTNAYVKAIDIVLSNEFEQIVSDHPLVEHEVKFDRELKVIVEHRKANFSSWYELFPRSAALDGERHGTFRDVIKLLPRVASMGFDVLYLPPIHPIGTVNRKGKNNSVRAEAGEPGSPWAIGSVEGGHKSIHLELGPLEDYKKLIGEAKKIGIDIALDLAFQCAPDHPYVKEHPEWFKTRPDGSIQYAENPPKKYQDIYPFNFECDDWKGLWHELKSVIFYWIDNGVKIFRVDNPHTKPIRFWQWVIAEVNKHYDDIIFLSEAFTKPKVMASLAKIGFTQSYTYFTWRVGKYEIVEYMNELVNGSSRNYFRPNFWPNTPDILPYHLQHQGENIFIIRLALAATLSSNYGVYGPPYEFCENLPVEGREEYWNSEKYEIRKYDWKRTNRMTDIITLLNKARKEHKSLQSTWNVRFLAIENTNLLAYLKATEDLSDIMLIVVNLDQHSKQSGYVQLPRETLKLGDQINVKLFDLVTYEDYTWTQEWNYVELDPYVLPFHLFKLTVHESNL
ncbi:MAG TPA: alpha-1,4-glucan--maltose-1-phosphate maltosyltransferase [Cyclobacteriaceae bacterium]|nr:alpha-1,4-glucan--maltose-1-phosphate maltosyltransferase [Cyclobacteriaceae bacterium]